MTAALHFMSRGIGLERIACFVCGDDDGHSLNSNIAAFVDGRPGGEAVVALFTELGCAAVLDFRPSEPTWVQVKVGACPDHAANLIALNAAVTETTTIDAAAITGALGGTRPTATEPRPAGSRQPRRRPDPDRVPTGTELADHIDAGGAVEKWDLTEWKPSPVVSAIFRSAPVARLAQHGWRTAEGPGAYLPVDETTPPGTPRPTEPETPAPAPSGWRRHGH
jgi:hypothetical protein